MAEVKIHTLNARDNIMLEVMRDYFSLSPDQMRREIQGALQMLESALCKKNIIYSDLKTALVPDTKRKEIALIFDTKSIESIWYGLDVFSRIIPLLEKGSNHSILVGDYIVRPENVEELFSAFEESVQLRRSVDFFPLTQFYIVYINNLTDAMFSRFPEALVGYEAYVGFADMTYASRFKLYLSIMLVNLGIKHKSVFIQGHESDLDASEDVNVCGYPFEQSGFTCRSVSSDLEGLFLSYKIERPVLPGFEVDTEFALNSISICPLPLEGFTVEVEEAKLKYIKDKKQGSIERVGLESATTQELNELIKDRIKKSYIYNLIFVEEYNISKFNIIVELPSKMSCQPTRLLAAMEYKPNEKVLRLITLY